MRLLRRLALLFVELLAVALFLSAVGLYAVSEYVDTEGFRQRFVAVVEALTGQRVVLHGELNIALYPVLSLEVRNLSLKERPEGGDAPLVHFDRLFVSARLSSLLTDRLEIRSIVVRGARLDLARLAEGEYNWRPLPTSNQESAESGYFDSVSLDELEVDNATISYVDHVSGQKLRLAGIALHTGSIEPGKAVPFTAGSLFSWKNGGVESKLVLKGLMEVNASGNLLLRDASVYATFGGPFLPRSAKPAELAANVRFDLDNRQVSLEKCHIQFLGLSGEGELRSGDLGQGIGGEGRLTLRPFTPSEVVKRFFPNAPLNKVDGLRKGGFAASFAFDEKGVRLRDMTAVLDGLTVRGSLEMRGFSRPEFTYDLQGDVVDLDPYLPLFRTDTPFVWGDFHLDVFRAFRGAGKVRADEFRVLGVALSDVRLAASADGRAVQVQGSAVRKGMGPLGGDVKFLFDDDRDVTTLGLEGELTAESGPAGFDFLRGDRWAVTGKGRLALSLRTQPVRCLRRERSIGVLRRTSLNARLTLGRGEGRCSSEDGKPRRQTYGSAVLSLKAEPAPSKRTGFFGFDVDGTLSGKGGAPFDAFSLSAIGPVRVDVDDGRVVGEGVDASVRLTGSVYTPSPDRLSAEGRLFFDSSAGTLEWRKGGLHLLETAVNGEAKVDGSGKTLKAAGKIEIPSADARRVIYLLTRKQLDLNDPAALKAVRVSADFAASETGFTLSGVQGELDGMPFGGLVVGQGWSDPVLTVSLTGGKLDLDRYLPRSGKPTLDELRAGKQPKKAEPVPLPLDFLRSLRVSGKLALEEFKLARIRTRKLSGVLKAEKGELRLSALKGGIYGGALTGDLSGEVGRRALTTRLKLSVQGMQAGPLMLDLADREYVKGATDLELDLASSGATDEDILANLEGKSRVVVTDGSFKFSGFDAPTAPEKTTSRAMPDSTLSATRPPQSRRTPFSKASALFVVRKGVFTLDPFRLDSTLLTATGSGWFSLPDDRIKLSVRNDFVAVPSVTIDVVGKLSDPEIKVPKGKILNNTVRNILGLPQKSFKFLRDLFL